MSEELVTTIDGIGHNGEGVGRIGGKAVFIPGAIPGETVSCQVIKENRSMMRARLEAVMEPSPYRVAPPCPYYGICQGCAYQHMSYEGQLMFKKQVVEQQLSRIGGWKGELAAVWPAPRTVEYRNKVEWQLFMNDSGRARLGYVNQDGRSELAVEHCLLLDEKISDLSCYMQERSELLFLAGVRRVGIRWSRAEQALMVNLFSINDQPSLSLLDSLKKELSQCACLNFICGQGIIRLNGPGYLVEKAGGMDFRISAMSFFQVNPEAAELLFGLVREEAALKIQESVIDAYCGTGVMAIQLAALAGRVLGIDSNPEAVQDARNNAAMNQQDNCAWLIGECEEVLPALEESCDVLILDPPRAGCRPAVLEGVRKLEPRRIVYVSCNPATLARDLKILRAGGYDVEKAQAVDMFPQTWHVETVVSMSRGAK